MLRHSHTWFLVRGKKSPCKYRWYHRMFPKWFMRPGDRLECPCGFVMRWVKWA